MLYAIGLDAVEIKRFAQWHLFPQARLLRIFSEQEIAYCLSVSSKSAERFAVRFAAREALFKACSQAGFNNNIPFLRFCRCVEVMRTPQGVPYFQIAWDKIIGDKTVPELIENIDILLSLTHTETTAIASIVMQKRV